ncbi:MAG: UPF0280 family protein [Candidatus Omnitrophica bacterium]|nr:UPF0280 family protein [Candidatus Omnitrophota bacterium]
MIKSRVAVQETDLLISCDKPVDLQYCRSRIMLYRRQIQSYISRDERFLTSLKPVSVERIAPAIVRSMADAALKADVGPMAAVAGAIAWFVGKDLIKKGCRELIVENGGDIFARSARRVTVGIYAGRACAGGRIKLLAGPFPGSFGICSSSGTVGHSLSFGKADCVTIVASNSVLADSAATACANRVNSKDDFPAALSFARSIRGVKGVLIACKKDILLWGKIQLA